MNRSYALIEAAVSCGSPTCGSEYAYDALLEAGLSDIFPAAAQYPMEKLPRCKSFPAHLRYLDTVMSVSRTLRSNLLSALESGHFPLVIGGDHSIEIGILAALGEHCGAENTALVYIDAHSDINTEKTSETHCIHGMDLAAACGLCCEELQAGKNRVNILGRNIHILGGRSIDASEWEIMDSLGVHLHSARELHERGTEAVLREVLPELSGKSVHVSFDVDSLDPSYFSATGYRIPDGLSRREAEELLTAVVPLAFSFDCVEYNPTLDPDGRDRERLLSLLRLVRDLGK